MTDIKSFKAFDADMKCRGFQYEVGKTYTHEGKVEECESGFHACESPLDVLRYYPLVGSRFAAVTQSGGTSKGESKIASARITVDAELQMPYFIKACVDWIKDRATTGNEANAATTGNWANAATTGDWANVATTGNEANAATTGDRANAATTGNRANAATTGDWANVATTGDRANAATTGNWANAATTGNEANAATTGDRSLAAALGRNSGAKASSGGAIMMVERSQDGSLLAVFASLVGENGIKPDVFYKLIDGKPVEVKK